MRPFQYQSIGLADRNHCTDNASEKVSITKKIQFYLQIFIKELFCEHQFFLKSNKKCMLVWLWWRTCRIRTYNISQQSLECDYFSVLIGPISCTTEAVRSDQMVDILDQSWTPMDRSLAMSAMATGKTLGTRWKLHTKPHQGNACSFYREQNFQIFTKLACFFS